MSELGMKASAWLDYEPTEQELANDLAIIAFNESQRAEAAEIEHANEYRKTMATIGRIDFSELGCHWLDPTSRSGRIPNHPERDECHRRLAEFVERYQVKPFRHRYRNLQALLKQGGAGNPAVKKVLERYFDARYGMFGWHYGKGSPFDHVELWGRNGIPLMLIGHPYGIQADARPTLDAIRGLGMVVSDYHSSWYGFGTCQVRVYHKATLDRLTGGVSVDV